MKYKTKEGDAKKYGEGYGVFLERTDFRKQVLNNFEEALSCFAKDFRSDAIQVLDIGCGNGEMTNLYLEAIKLKLPKVKINLDIVEPAISAIEEATKNLSKSGFNCQSFNSQADSFVGGDYFKSTKYDLIIASYVFYHIPVGLIGDLVYSLKTSGALMISMGSHNHPLRNTLNLRQISNHGDSNIIEDFLEARKLSVETEIETKDIKTNLRISGLRSVDGFLNEEGKSFFSFIYNTDVDSLSREYLNDILQNIDGAESRSSGIVNPVHHMYWIIKK